MATNKDVNGAKAGPVPLAIKTQVRLNEPLKHADIHQMISTPLRSVNANTQVLLGQSRPGPKPEPVFGEPFDVTIKLPFPDAEARGKLTVQVCDRTTLRELAQAIACEHDGRALLLRLVVMGKTLYNPGIEGGLRNGDRTMKMLGITARHVVWLKNANPMDILDV